MACSFTLAHAGTPDTLLPIASRGIAAQGGKLTGTATSGTVRMPSAAGEIAFSYTARGKQIAINVTDKPFVVSCARIQEELAKVVARVPAPEPIDAPGVVTHTTETPGASWWNESTARERAPVVVPHGNVAADPLVDEVLVAELQAVLRGYNQLGPGLDDGFWGPRTEAALAQVMKAQNLLYTVHVVDNRTVALEPAGSWAALRKGLADSKAISPKWLWFGLGLTGLAIYLSLRKR